MTSPSEAKPGSPEYFAEQVVDRGYLGAVFTEQEQATGVGLMDLLGGIVQLIEAERPERRIPGDLNVRIKAVDHLVDEGVLTCHGSTYYLNR